METKLITDEISKASDIIKNGGLVAVPTETVYGLAANGLNEKAVLQIYEVKGRPETKPLSLMVRGAEAMDELCDDVPESARVLAEIFWPGPLTIVLKAKPFIPATVLAGGSTVGLRCPDHKKTLELLRECGCPLAAPSANPSNCKSPVSADEVMAYFDGKIDAVIDGGRCAMGLESTVFDMSETPYRTLRAGALPDEEISMALCSAMTIIGITGGTGCGKTTALKVIEDMGGLVIDCDEVYHSLMNESAEMMDEINLRFPGVVPEGTHDTKALGEVVFNNPTELSALNAITHKFVGREISRRLFNWAREGGSIAAIDAIALFEGKIAGICKATVGITAPTEMRITRLMSREGISEEYARLRVNAQKSNEYFEQICDYTVCNDSTVGSFEEKCKITFNNIIRR